MSGHPYWHDTFKTPLLPAMQLMSQEEMVRRIELIRAVEGFDSRQTFETPLPSRTLLPFPRPPVLCAWCSKPLNKRQVKDGHACCSRACGAARPRAQRKAAS